LHSFLDVIAYFQKISGVHVTPTTPSRWWVVIKRLLTEYGLHVYKIWSL